MRQRSERQRDRTPAKTMITLAAFGLLTLTALIAATSPRLPHQSIQSAQDVNTATAITQGWSSDSATFTARVEVLSGSLLDRLTRNKPGIWGDKLLYIGLGALYIVLLSLLFRTIFREASVAESIADEDNS